MKTKKYVVRSLLGVEYHFHFLSEAIKCSKTYGGNVLNIYTGQIEYLNGDIA